MVDAADCIHELGYCERRGGLLVPPLGYQGDSAKFAKWSSNVLAQCTPAPSDCFLNLPENRPRSNFFKVGMKLEAVDRKYPHVISPASILEVKGDQILIGFDGYIF